MTGVNVRDEVPADFAAIRAVNDAAFGTTEESVLVDRLRAEGHALVSLVAELDRRVVGHVMFSRMWIRVDGPTVDAVALAPVAVLPEFQKRGIGSELIRRGLDQMRERGEEIVLVLGHPDYYPRFGFSTEKARGIESPFPAEAFMALELKDGALEGVQGAVVYPEAFGISG